MMKNKLVNNAGMIDKSHVEVRSATGDISMIGQFGGGSKVSVLGFGRGSCGQQEQ